VELDRYPVCGPALRCRPRCGQRFRRPEPGELAGRHHRPHHEHQSVGRGRSARHRGSAARSVPRSEGDVGRPRPRVAPTPARRAGRPPGRRRGRRRPERLARRQGELDGSTTASRPIGMTRRSDGRGGDARPTASSPDRRRGTLSRGSTGSSSATRVSTGSDAAGPPRSSRRRSALVVSGRSSAPDDRSEAEPSANEAARSEEH
jgi:hypothetical protein